MCAVGLVCGLASALFTTGCRHYRMTVDEFEDAPRAPRARVAMVFSDLPYSVNDLEVINEDPEKFDRQDLPDQIEFRFFKQDARSVNFEHIAGDFSANEYDYVVYMTQTRNKAGIGWPVVTYPLCYVTLSILPAYVPDKYVYKARIVRAATNAETEQKNINVKSSIIIWFFNMSEKIRVDMKSIVVAIDDLSRTASVPPEASTPKVTEIGE
ncbi:hypothetical protein K8I61_16565 [bacterium]|nr:hypothetical protein [bacterium]